MDHCSFSPDGTLLATASGDRTVRLWDGRNGKSIGAPLLHSGVPLKVSFSPDGRRLATACTDGTIRVWSVPEGALVLGPLHHETYLHVDEVRGDAYGFGGLTQERRYIAGQLEVAPERAIA